MSDDLATDELALRALGAQYAMSVDRRDPAGYVGVFLPDARLRIFDPADAPAPTSEIVGVGELAKVIDRIGRYDVTFHLVGTARYDVQGDVATGEVYCVAHHVLRGDPDTDDVMYIRYVDEYRRAGGTGDRAGREWKIAERVLYVDFRERRTPSPTTG
jgi:hypothetical protein